MISSTGASLSGYNAAAERIKVGANNLANQFSTSRVEGGKVVNEPYKPSQVQAVSQENGGVQTRVVEKNPATIKAANGSGELEEIPNVDTAEELTNIKLASYDAKANLTAIKVQDNLQQSLLDIFV